MIKNLKQEKISYLTYDVIFKSVFLRNENILAKMISDITGLDYQLFEDNIALEVNELPIRKKNEKAKRCDFIVRVDKNHILNLELNRKSHTGLIVKNLSYIFHLFSSNVLRGENYNSNLQVIQINLNCFQETEDKALAKYYLKEETSNQVFVNNLIIYSLNVAKCHELYYNETTKEYPNYIKWGALIYCQDLSEIPKITKGIMKYEERNIIMDKLNQITNDEGIMSELEALKWDEWERNTIYNDGVNDGIEQGKEEGREMGKEETLITIIKTMLAQNYSIETIKKVTNCSDGYILNLKEKS